MSKIEWHECHDNVTLLGRVLVASGYNAEQLQNYYERPWAFAQEWRRIAAKMEQERVDGPATKVF